MRNDMLLNLYKEEKQLIADPIMCGTDFPTFQKWKNDYMNDYNMNHRTVNVNQADAELEQHIKEASTLPIPKALQEENKTMSKNTTATSTVNPTPRTPVEPVVKAPSKFQLAQAIFDEKFNKVPRKEIINAFISDAGCTANGASTYYQKMKKAAETTS